MPLLGPELDFDEDELWFRYAVGRRRRVMWGGLQRVLIETNDRGPLDEDLFFVVEDDRNTLRIPQVLMTNRVLERLQALPGFDNALMAKAMTVIEPAEFILWSRQSK